ncbi:cell division protein FtsK [Jeotgalibacillus sp. S-D1]|uniref:FtsK/SpoIIIE domain-containing protein n=1 Tax=Jeotgalibacillus sp. S-D1 TaxID=2552189 RepID=UPI0010598D69|nr:FtsK/SpoIIIE domain-containing protein [Jeotgalibacillus sp. S-D1]TDL34594.1 cell division protein FtsK [Jeotgalibacillus sp. S-D1]
MINFFHKARLKNAFILAELYTSKKKKTFKETIEYKRYPNIIDFRNENDYLMYVFLIPQGMNPAEIEKKEYIFHQVFQNYEIEGDGHRYILKVFKTELTKELKYDYESFKQHLNGGLPILAGMSMIGKMATYDMVEHPHLLIAGETGSGKSVTIRAIITTILLHMQGKIDLYLGDMKRSEFHVFRNVESVVDVMTDKERLLKRVNEIKNELTRRGNLMDKHEVEHIDEYNKIKGVPFEKYILLAIDEVALLKKETEIMSIVEEISCIGRALGVFLLLSMQRPDANVLEGQLKNNLTVRFGFRHSDKINSNITLGAGTMADASTIKADKKGQFYMKSEKTILLQAPYLPLQEARNLLKPFKRKNEGEKGEVSEDFMSLPLFKE